MADADTIATAFSAGKLWAFDKCLAELNRLAETNGILERIALQSFEGETRHLDISPEALYCAYRDCLKEWYNQIEKEL